MGKRATRKAQVNDGIVDLEIDALKAENLQLKEEVERLRLRNAGAHPAAALADALHAADEVGDVADDALTMYAASMVIRSELGELLSLFKATIEDYERRLDLLGEGPAATGAHAAADASLDENEQLVSPGNPVSPSNEARVIVDPDGPVTIDLRDDALASVHTPHYNGTTVGQEPGEDSTPTAKGA